MIQIVSNHRSI